jgi:GDP-4-dehydro-6-deoxy-D-mannose reductase
MRVLLTGATGFVGRWLAAELVAAGHEALVTPPSIELDLRDTAATLDFVLSIQPEALAHLAAISYGPDAARDPERAMGVNVAGTVSVLRAVSRLRHRIPILVSGSSEVYGSPEPDELPLKESAPLRSISAYGQSKVAQEQAALALAREYGLPMVVTRSFNHTGPGQRRDFVVPAIAARIYAAGGDGRGESAVHVGNVNVRRDIGDVRDVVRAYRFLLELASRADPGWSLVANVCTGRSVLIRDMIDTLAEAAGTSVTIEVDPSLLRLDDPPEIVGDHGLLTSLTGWEPAIPLRQTLWDVMADVRQVEGPRRSLA